MHFLFSIVAFLVLELASLQDCVDVKHDAQYDYKVAGGYDIGIKDAPYQVSLQYDIGNRLKHGCGGSLISDKFVVSAAHCESLGEDLNFSPSKIRIGSSRADCGGSLINIKNVIVNPGWEKSNESSNDNDIAIFELEQAVKFSNSTQSIKLIGQNEVLEVGDINVVSGWRLTLEHPVELLPPLQATKLPIIDRDECQRYFKMIQSSNLTERMICAGNIGEGK